MLVSGLACIYCAVYMCIVDTELNPFVCLVYSTSVNRMSTSNREMLKRTSSRSERMIRQRTLEEEVNSLAACTVDLMLVECIHTLVTF